MFKSNKFGSTPEIWALTAYATVSYYNIRMYDDVATETRRWWFAKEFHLFYYSRWENRRDNLLLSYAYTFIFILSITLWDRMSHWLLLNIVYNTFIFYVYTTDNRVLSCVILSYIIWYIDKYVVSIARSTLLWLLKGLRNVTICEYVRIRYRDVLYRFSLGENVYANFDHLSFFTCTHRLFKEQRNSIIFQKRCIL